MATNRDKIIAVTVSEDEKKCIEAMADAKHLTTAAFIRLVLLEKYGIRDAEVTVSE